MTFASIPFLFYFLPLFVAAYFATPWKNSMLLAGSLVFYAWGEPVYVLALLVSVTLNHFIGTAIGRSRTPRRLAIGVSVNLAALAWFKYAGFLVGGLAAALAPVGVDPAELDVETHLPLGISFYTFQAISYLVDIYRGDASAPRRWRDTALFIAMFPQLIAGPIVRFKTVEAQIRQREHTFERCADGVRLFVQGLAQKVLFANSFALVADASFDAPPGSIGIGAAWLGVVAYALQIYFDFAGYSSMALGLGRAFGFDFPRNFDFPYISRSVTEFWRRWHMSLSQWFRDYLYIPLGGNRGTKLQTYRNLWIVFLLCGLWHGAAIAFVFWGAYHGGFLVLERTRFGRWLEAAPSVVRHVYLLLVALLGWVPFRTEDMGEALAYYGNLVGITATGGATVSFDAQGLEFVFVVGVAAAMWPMIWGERGALRSIATPARARLGVAYAYGIFVALGGLFVFSAAELANGAYNPFIYFRF